LLEGEKMKRLTLIIILLSLVFCTTTNFAFAQKIDFSRTDDDFEVGSTVWVLIKNKGKGSKDKNGFFYPHCFKRFLRGIIIKKTFEQRVSFGDTFAYYKGLKFMVDIIAEDKLLSVKECGGKGDWSIETFPKQNVLIFE
jgi:hypothetical protein